MKYLGVDYGEKMVGIAVSDEEGKIAFPRMAVPHDEDLLALLVTIVREEDVGAIIMGDTRTVSGGENPVTKDAEAFADTLAKATAVPVRPAFEGWSSIEASRYAPKGEEHNDAAAAAIILQRFLDMHEGAVQ